MSEGGRGRSVAGPALFALIGLSGVLVQLAVLGISPVAFMFR